MVGFLSLCLKSKIVSDHAHFKTITKMSSEETVPDLPPARPAKKLSPEAKRALAEAAERRAKAEAETLPPELGGANGEEPTRFGDWERRGIAVDF